VIAREFVRAERRTTHRAAGLEKTSRAARRPPCGGPIPARRSRGPAPRTAIDTDAVPPEVCVASAHDDLPPASAEDDAQPASASDPDGATSTLLPTSAASRVLDRGASEMSGLDRPGSLDSESLDSSTPSDAASDTPLAADAEAPDASDAQANATDSSYRSRKSRLRFPTRKHWPSNESVSLVGLPVQRQ
jgi:hypothetical protein